MLERATQGMQQVLIFESSCVFTICLEVVTLMLACCVSLDACVMCTEYQRVRGVGLSALVARRGLLIVLDLVTIPV